MIFYDPSLSSTPPWPDAPATPASLLDHIKLGYTYDTDPAVPAMEVAAMEPEERAKAQAEPAEARRADPLKQRRLRIDARDHFRKRLEELEEVPPRASPNRETSPAKE